MWLKINERAFSVSMGLWAKTSDQCEERAEAARDVEVEAGPSMVVTWVKERRGRRDDQVESHC